MVEVRSDNLSGLNAYVWFNSEMQRRETRKPLTRTNGRKTWGQCTRYVLPVHFAEVFFVPIYIYCEFIKKTLHKKSNKNHMQWEHKKGEKYKPKRDKKGNRGKI